LAVPNEPVVGQLYGLKPMPIVLKLSEERNRPLMGVVDRTASRNPLPAALWIVAAPEEEV